MRPVRHTMDIAMDDGIMDMTIFGDVNLEATKEAAAWTDLEKDV